MNAKTRLAGVDYGSVRLGLSISDGERRLASPLTVYQRGDRARDAAYFLSLVEAEDVGGFVVGLPVHCDGREGQKAAEARSFGAWLAETTALPVVFWDERFSTVEAESALWQAGLTHKKRKARRDGVAAQIFLQAYLDAGCPDESSAEPLDDR
jgi:putative Holliday junction resolvase